MTDYQSEEYQRTRLFRKALHFYSFLEGGEFGMLDALLQKTDIGQQRLNEIFDYEEDDELITSEEMESIAAVINIPADRMIWNQQEMNRLYSQFDLDYDVEVRDINKRVLNASINPLQFARAVMATIFSDGAADPKEQKFFTHLKNTFSLNDEIIMPLEESEEQFEHLITSLPQDSRFLTIVVKWIIGAVFADGEVSPEEVDTLGNLLRNIQAIRGELHHADVTATPTI